MTNLIDKLLWNRAYNNVYFFKKMNHTWYYAKEKIRNNIYIIISDQNRNIIIPPNSKLHEKFK